MATSEQRSLTKPVIGYKEESQPVQIVYDTWTPRPHFIIVQLEKKADATTAELQAAFEITGRFLLANRAFAEDAILSFHCGKWYQQYTSKWHAHLCVPQQAYLEKARIEVTEIPNNKEWRGAKTVEEGMSNWHKRHMITYNKYQKECIERSVSSRTRVEGVILSRFNSTSNEFILVWLSSAPRIGIVACSPGQSNLASLYTFMADTRAAVERALVGYDQTFANFGCHLCLYVRGQSGTSVTCRSGRVLTEDGVLNENPNIVGYIQMDECQYVQWLPHRVRGIWLDEFRAVAHHVRT